MTVRKPKGRSELFLSCDLVGSTQYKQKAGQRWQETFLAFYRQFPQALSTMCKDMSPELDFKLWKPVGDELIFKCRVTHERQIYRAVRTWIAAMDYYEQNTLAKEGLGTKGGAFVATFPGPDSESTIPLNPDQETSDKGLLELNNAALSRRNLNQYMYDYFGPSIDTGFRILGACSSRYFTLSTEVAWAMSQSSQATGLNNADFHCGDLVLVEARSLKGVWNGREYPIFAVDRHEEDMVNKALRVFSGPKLEAQHISDLCRECAASPGWPSALYLPDSGIDEFKQNPVDPLAGMIAESRDGAEVAPSSDPGTKNLSASPPVFD